ncbi:MAG TPA: pyridoxamine 5'-phosphate oxidase family protein, partial [Galbitalea sp.]|nr:pyridoxamine 5'-phosphate oxidase family protein [Galbitalea sp.]
MDQHDLENELNQDGARELLEKGSLLRLAYNGHDGLPRVIPIGFLWNGTEVVVCTVVSSPKVRALKSRPDVAITIDDGATPADAKSLLLRGVAKIEIVDGVPAEYLAAAKKSLDHQQAAEFEAEVTKMYDEMARISIVPAWARFYDFGAGRLPSF